MELVTLVRTGEWELNGRGGGRGRGRNPSRWPLGAGVGRGVCSVCSFPLSSQLLVQESLSRS